MTAADNLCERLIARDVKTIYGFPGDAINGILGALRRHEDELRFVQTRHEEMAAFMDCGHAKVHGRCGRLHGNLRRGGYPHTSASSVTRQPAQFDPRPRQESV